MSHEREHEHGKREACTADAAAYVLGALPDEEHRAFAEHLRSCLACSEEVAELQTVADALPASVSQLTAPPELRTRVLTEIGGRPPSARGEAGGARSGARARDAEREPRARLLRRPRLVLGGLAAGAVALAVALALALSAGGGSQPRVIRAAVRAPGASAALRVNASTAELVISGMPQAAPQRVYEVWVKRAGPPRATDALFTVSRAGDATVAVPGGVAGVRTVLVTSEPRGGSSVPTSSPVIVANLG